MKKLKVFLFQIIALLLVLNIFSISIKAQVCTSTNTPATLGPSYSWPQNALVSVNVNANDYTQVEYENCILPVFEAFNLSNAATGAGYGNFSGVYFSVTRSTNAVATRVAVQGGYVANNAQYISFGLQVNRDDLPDNERGVTTTGVNDADTHRISAVIRQNDDMTNCSAIMENLAHEIGHTFGLGECSNCANGSSVMKPFSCPFGSTPIACLNSTGAGRTSPSQCDNTKIQQNSNYNSATMDQPDVGGGGCAEWDMYYCLDSSPWNSWDPYSCHCTWGTGECGGGENCTPILVDVNGNGFDLTSAEDGVMFDVNADSVIASRISWTSGSSDDAWLGLDRNANGQIDNGAELFGNFTPQPEPPVGVGRNGFLALAEFDKLGNGGNGDGIITAQDAIFTNLLLWQDANQNAFSEPSELHSLSEFGISRIDLAYRESRRIDRYGNQFRYRSKIWDILGAESGRWAWDVILISEQ